MFTLITLALTLVVIVGIVLWARAIVLYVNYHARQRHRWNAIVAIHENRTN